MARMLLFAGPTLPDAAELVRGTGVEVRPPVSAGDLLALDVGAGDVVGIVDGYFHQRRAIPHKEIIELLGRGSRVLGSSSMGALRAAELHTFGMEGIGQVFAAYHSSSLRADDEVTLLHGSADDGYLHLSEPLVNIRATLRAAMAEGICTADDVDLIVAFLAGLPYRDRSYQVLLHRTDEIGIDRKLLDRVVRRCRTNPIDLKRADALELLTELTRGIPLERIAPTAVPTIYLHQWRSDLKDPKLRAAHQLAQVIAPDYPIFYETTVFRWLVDQCAHECGRKTRSLTDRRALLEGVVDHGAHRGLYSPDLDDLDFLASWSTAEERIRATQSELLARFLARSFRIRPGIVHTDLILSAFQRTDACDRTGSLLSRVNAVNELGRTHRTDFDHTRIAVDQIIGWLSVRWRVPAEDIELAAHDRGFESIPQLIDAARPLYLPAQCDNAVASFSLY
ncbi:hypothetical protein SAMN04488074_13155 [Lentzea albidocapillata subsp. violacea]|uniref:TfuA-like core domain-containing protein n=1 Tax=Lentzea albidocapillata subsp. violacea TaxID=128104 RepID=A0A1G9XVD9_9PSEU|nr:TfuA-like protein [Lentzea albidocapillata]SDN00700.1 hypothetical protein SAMN04488074_13155 [Lentzea albidocapillata subsp. violacea]